MIRVCWRLGTYADGACAGQPLHGVPLNINSVKTLSNTVFKEPTPYPVDALHVVVTPGYNPHNRRGEWRGLCPEELTHGMIFAVADAVRSEAGNTDLLNAWTRCLLSTPFAFAELATAK